MKYNLALSFIIISTFVYGSKCQLAAADSSKENKILSGILTKLAASDKGPSCVLVKINNVDKKVIPEEKVEMYTYNAKLKINNGKEETCRVLVKIDFVEKGDYLVTFLCPRKIISRQLKASGEVKVNLIKSVLKH